MIWLQNLPGWHSKRAVLKNAVATGVLGQNTLPAVKFYCNPLKSSFRQWIKPWLNSPSQFQKAYLLLFLRRLSELAREMGIAAAIHWYQQGCISMERAAEAAGMDRPRFLQELARRKVDVFALDAEELAREFGNL
jgi:predicted HTH domain antitoxin